MTKKLPIAHLPKPPRAWLTLLMGGVLLISGMVIGAGGTTLLLKHRMGQPNSAPKQFSGRLLRRIERDLDLTEEQSEEVRSILELHREEMRTIRLQVGEKIDDSFEALKEEVSAVLSPEQVVIWEERNHKYRDRSPHDRGPRGGGRGGRDDGPRHRRRGDSEDMRDGRDRGSRRPREGGDGFDGRRPPPRHENFDGGDEEDFRRPPRDGERPPPPPDRRREDEPSRPAPPEGELLY